MKVAEELRDTLTKENIAIRKIMENREKAEKCALYIKRAWQDGIIPALENGYLFEWHELPVSDLMFLLDRLDAKMPKGLQGVFTATLPCFVGADMYDSISKTYDFSLYNTPPTRDVIHKLLEEGYTNFLSF